jgi:hypothetical protein
MLRGMLTRAGRAKGAPFPLQDLHPGAKFADVGAETLDIPAQPQLADHHGLDLGGRGDGHGVDESHEASDSAT